MTIQIDAPYARMVREIALKNLADLKDIYNRLTQESEPRTPSKAAFLADIHRTIQEDEAALQSSNLEEFRLDRS